MLDMKEKSVKSMMKSGGKELLASRRARMAKAKRAKPMDLMPLLCSRRPKQRVTLARTASPMVTTTGARVRVGTKRIHVGITSRQRKGA